MGFFSRTVLAVVASVCFALSPVSASAESGKVILTIDGAISGGQPRDFTLEQLDALGSRTIETETPWHDGVVTFEGVPLATLMEHVGAPRRDGLCGGPEPLQHRDPHCGFRGTRRHSCLPHERRGDERPGQGPAFRHLSL